MLLLAGSIGAVVGGAALLMFNKLTGKGGKSKKRNHIHKKQSAETKEVRQVVSKPEWLEARRALLSKEKEATKGLDAVVEARRALPWTKVSDYVFKSTNGSAVKLSDLFAAGKDDLICYHFMFDGDWDDGCSSCSLWCDGLNGYLPHIQSRANFVVIAKAGKDKLQKIQSRKQWGFKLLSSADNDFNKDCGVEPTEQELETKFPYNFGTGTPFKISQFPGISIFHRDEKGNIYLTYGAQARGLDMVNACYQLFDFLPKGRDGFEVRHKDKYEAK